MNLRQMFKPRPARLAGEALYEAATRQARQPDFYRALGVPDSPEGRFELYSLHVVLLLHRLKGEGGAAAETAQVLFDTYVSALDHALREMGVGDLSVAKKMRKLGEAFFGRVKSYHAAFAALPDEGPLRDLLTRTVYAEVDPSQVQALADYVTAQRAHLAAQPIEGFFGGRVDWRPL